MTELGELNNLRIKDNFLQLISCQGSLIKGRQKFFGHICRMLCLGIDLKAKILAFNPTTLTLALPSQVFHLFSN